VEILQLFAGRLKYFGMLSINFSGEIIIEKRDVYFPK
jgi:hypothetical protein